MAVFCGSSDAAEPALLSAAAKLGGILAREQVRLVYGGGGIGLMGACAGAARGAGGRVLGVIPAFLTHVEAPPAGAETVVVASMHARKMRMFEEADAFAVLPGAIGTLEEAIELLSWRRLGLHAKPIVFYSPDGFWDPLFSLFRRVAEARLLPAGFETCWRVVDDIAAVLPALRSMPASPPIAPAMADLT
ncbi:MAG: TIGR00730 family Rossman fold protein [Caulobacteraceae bacterium]